MGCTKMSDGIITNKIRELRTEMKITQQDLAKQIGVSRQTIIVMEKGVYDPSLKLAFKIALMFNKQIEEIFTYIK